MKYLILLIALIFSTNLMASEWVGVSSGEGVAVYVDKSSITFDKKIGKAWSMFIYDDVQKLEDGKEYNKIKSLSKFNCTNFTNATLQYGFYMGSNVISYHEFQPQYISYSDTIPDSITDFIFKYVCKSK